MLIDVVRFGHLIGIALGFGLAIYADGRFLRALSAPVRAAELETVRAIHSHVVVAMGILWATGMALLYVRTGFELAQFSPKLYFKIGLVSLLTFNAVLIGRRAIPQMARYEGWSYMEMPVRARLQLAFIGAVSAACWISLLALGVFQAFKTMPAAAIADVLRWVFIPPFVGAAAIALVLPLVHAARRVLARRRAGSWRLQRRATHRPSYRFAALRR